MKIYLIGCLIAFLLTLTIPYRKWKEGRDIVLADVYVVVTFTAFSYLTWISFLVWCMFEIKDKIIIKNKFNEN